MREPEDRPERRFATWTLLSDGVAHVEEYAAKFELNETGTFLWLRCDGSRTVRELAHELAEAFDAPADEAESATAEFVAWLRQARLLEPERPAAARDAAHATRGAPVDA